MGQRGAGRLCRLRDARPVHLDRSRDAPAAVRAATISSLFVVFYVAISLPIIGVGLVAELASLRASGVSFSVFIGLLSAVGLLRLRRG